MALACIFLPRRRRLVALLAGAGLPLLAGTERPGAKPGPLQFPQDHGAHPEQRTEWWYATGQLRAGERTLGFQLTFFRTRVEGTQQMRSSFAAKQLIFAHAALTDVEGRRHWQDQRTARAGHGIAGAEEGDTRVMIRDWTLSRQGDGSYHARLEAASFALDLQLAPTQPVLLHGEGGWISKGAGQRNAYYSQPQLQVRGRIRAERAVAPASGSGWLDHEWGDALMATQAVGWDWLGMNLKDGSALMALMHRRADGSAHFIGGTYRKAGGRAQSFPAGSTALVPVRFWRSPRSGARYPVEWDLRCPAGRFRVRPLLDDQEVDSRASTGAFYWEGLSELVDERGGVAGTGYLELTGYAAPLRM